MLTAVQELADITTPGRCVSVCPARPPSPLRSSQFPRTLYCGAGVVPALQSVSEQPPQQPQCRPLLQVSHSPALCRGCSTDLLCTAVRIVTPPAVTPAVVTSCSSDTCSSDFLQPVTSILQQVAVVLCNSEGPADPPPACETRPGAVATINTGR